MYSKAGQFGCQLKWPKRFLNPFLWETQGRFVSLKLVSHRYIDETVVNKTTWIYQSVFIQPFNSTAYIFAAKCSKSTLFLRNIVDLVPLSCEDGLPDDMCAEVISVHNTLTLKFKEFRAWGMTIEWRVWLLNAKHGDFRDLKRENRRVHFHAKVIKCLQEELSIIAFWVIIL